MYIDAKYKTLISNLLQFKHFGFTLQNSRCIQFNFQKGLIKGFDYNHLNTL